MKKCSNEIMEKIPKKTFEECIKVTLEEEVPGAILEKTFETIFE